MLRIGRRAAGMMTLSESASLTRRQSMSNLPDFGDWGNGPDDAYTAPEHIRRFYFSFNCGTLTRWGTARAPRSWSKKRIQRHGLFAYTSDLNVSFDVLSLRHLVDSET
jgi:hypothetical protein